MPPRDRRSLFLRVLRATGRPCYGQTAHCPRVPPAALGVADLVFGGVRAPRDSPVLGEPGIARMRAITLRVVQGLEEAGFLVSAKSTLELVTGIFFLGKYGNLGVRTIRSHPRAFLQMFNIWLRLSTRSRPSTVMWIFRRLIPCLIRRKKGEHRGTWGKNASRGGGGP